MNETLNKVSEECSIEDPCIIHILHQNPEENTYLQQETHLLQWPQVPTFFREKHYFVLKS
jgi:hypothetical protein